MGNELPLLQACTLVVGAIVRQKYAVSFFPPTYLKLHEAKETVMWWQRPDYHNAGVTFLPQKYSPACCVPKLLI